MTKSAILFIGAALLANFAWAANPKISKDLEGVDPQQETEVIVQFAKAPTRAHHNMVESRGGVLRSVLPLVRAAAYKMRAGTLEDLANEPDVVYITPNRPLHSTLDNVTSSVNATTAWNMGLTGAGVGVAVIDSGISYGQDLDSTIVVDNEWFTRYDGNDEFGHGTHVAGILAGSGAASHCVGCFRNLQGVAPGAKIVNLRVLDQNGAGTDSAVIAAINRAIALKSQYNIRVINLSLGRPVYESYQARPALPGRRSRLEGRHRGGRCRRQRRPQQHAGHRRLRHHQRARK